MERVKAENEAKKAELNKLSEKIADQTLELEETKEEKALLEADKNFFREQAQNEAQRLRADIERLRAEKQAKESTIATIDETMERKQAILDDVNENFDERLYDFEKRKVMKQYTELTGVPKYFKG